MSYELVAIVFLVLVFCFFTMLLAFRGMVSMFNAAKPDGMKESRLIPERKPKKTKTQRENEAKAAEERRQYETIIRNLEAYDGTGIGQEEVR